MLIYWNKRKYLQEKRVQLPEDLLATPTWPPLRHVKTLYSKFDLPWPFLYPEIHNTTPDHTTYAFYTVTHIKTIIFWLWLRLWLWLSSLSLIRGGFYDHFPGNSKISNFILILKKCRPLQSSGPTWSPIFFKWLSLKILRYHCGQTSHNEWYYLVCLCSPRQTNIVNVFL